MKDLYKIIKNNEEFQIKDVVARQNIEVLATALDDLEIPDKVSDLEDGNQYSKIHATSAYTREDGVLKITEYYEEGFLKERFTDNEYLTQIIFGDEITSITLSQFSGCTNLTQAYVKNPSISKLITIGVNTFAGCTKLRFVDVSECLQNIGARAFSGCTSLNNLYLPNTVTSIGTDAFADLPTEGTLTCSKYWFEHLSEENLTNLGNVANWRKSYIEETSFEKVATKVDLKQDILVSGTNIKTINGNSILGEGNITVSGGASGDYLPLSGGTLSGHIQVGDGNTTAFKKFEAVRQVNSVPNGAAFYVNSDNTASFFHKTYATTGLTGAVNDAILKFNNEGLYFAKGETNRTSATDFKEVLTEETAYKKTESDNKYATKEEVEELQLFKFPNATIFGTPTIQNGQVSNFTNTNYLQFPFLVDFQNRPFNIDFSFTTPSVMSGQENILDSNFGLAFAIRNGKVVAVASDNGTSWTTGELISDETLSPNTTYYFKISWNEGIFGYSGGTAKDDYSISKETVMSNTPYPKTMVIGRSFVDGGNHYNGSINLNDASLKISDKVVWTGMDDVGLATRAAIDLSNIDDKGKEVIETIVDALIPSVPTFTFDPTTQTLNITTN